MISRPPRSARPVQGRSSWPRACGVWSGRPEDAGHRSGVLRAMHAQSMELSELNVEYGYCYQSAAVVPDGSAAPAPADGIRVYQPSTRPGAPLPHAWIDGDDGNRRPVKDLLAPGRFLLIAGEDGHAWCQAARQLAAEAGIPLDAVRIGHLDGDYHDPRCAWQRHRQIASDGAILVRPDRFIAWRHPRRRDPGPSLLPRSARSSPGRSAHWPRQPSDPAVRGRAASPARPRPLSQLQVRFPARLIILLQGPSDGRVLLLSHLHPSLGQLGLGLFGLRLGPCGLRRDSRLGCLLTTVSWLRSLNERTCLAWTMRQLLSEPPPASALTLVTRAVRGAARRPLQIKVHHLRLPSGRLGLSVPVSQGP